MLVRVGNAYGIGGIAGFDRDREMMEFSIVRDNKTADLHGLAIA